jgi:transcriptional regulator with XRE-family HTH domain
MALFFDAAWFDARLQASGLARDDVATALGLSRTEVAELWKDQRELKADDVRLLAALLGSTPQEIATRAGISTPVPKETPSDHAAIMARLDRLEREIGEIKALLQALAARRP